MLEGGIVKEPPMPRPIGKVSDAPPRPTPRPLPRTRVDSATDPIMRPIPALPSTPEGMRALADELDELARRATMPIYRAVVDPLAPPPEPRRERIVRLIQSRAKRWGVPDDEYRQRARARRTARRLAKSRAARWPEPFVAADPDDDPLFSPHPDGKPAPPVEAAPIPTVGEMRGTLRYALRLLHFGFAMATATVVGGALVAPELRRAAMCLAVAAILPFLLDFSSTRTHLDTWR